MTRTNQIQHFIIQLDIHEWLATLQPFPQPTSIDLYSRFREYWYCGMQLHLLCEYNTKPPRPCIKKWLQQTRQTYFSTCPPYSAALTCCARYFCSQSSNNSITMSQDAGCLPAPFNHVWNISVQQAAGPFTLWFASIKSSFLPSSSNSNKTPKSFHVGAMEVIISILVPSRHFRERSSESFGFVAVKKKTIKVISYC